MLIQAVRFTFAPEDAERVAVIFKELQALSLEEPGVVSFHIGRSRDNPGIFALWEEYRDEAALKAHMASAHFARLVIDGVRKLATERRADIVFPHLNAFLRRRNRARVTMNLRNA